MIGAPRCAPRLHRCGCRRFPRALVPQEKYNPAQGNDLLFAGDDPDQRGVHHILGGRRFGRSSVIGRAVRLGGPGCEADDLGSSQDRRSHLCRDRVDFGPRWREPQRTGLLQQQRLLAEAPQSRLQFVVGCAQNTLLEAFRRVARQLDEVSGGVAAVRPGQERTAGRAAGQPRRVRSGEGSGDLHRPFREAQSRGGIEPCNVLGFCGDRAFLLDAEAELVADFGQLRNLEDVQAQQMVAEPGLDRIAELSGAQTEDGAVDGGQHLAASEGAHAASPAAAPGVSAVPRGHGGEVRAAGELGAQCARNGEHAVPLPRRRTLRKEEKDLCGCGPGTGHVRGEALGELLVGNHGIDIDHLLAQLRQHQFVQGLLGGEPDIQRPEGRVGVQVTGQQGVVHPQLGDGPDHLGVARHGAVVGDQPGRVFDCEAVSAGLREGTGSAGREQERRRQTGGGQGGARHIVHLVRSRICHT